MPWKNWTTIYITEDVINELKSLEINLSWFDLKKNNDKIKFLIANYKQSLEK